MAGEIRLQAATGLTVKALILNETGAIWNGSSIVSPAAVSNANWTGCLVSCAEAVTSNSAGVGVYVGTWPGGLTQSALYSTVFYTGVAPAPGALAIGAQDDPTEYMNTQLATLVADSPNTITKNVAFANFTFPMVLASNGTSMATGISITAERSIDGAAFGACANSVSEVNNGVYKLNLAATDLNGDIICLRFTSATANTRIITIATQPT